MEEESSPPPEVSHVVFAGRRSTPGDKDYRIICIPGKYDLRRGRRITLLLLLTALLSACGGRSVAPVSRRPVTREAPRIENRLPAISYTIQVGAFSTPLRAALYANKLRASGLSAFYFVDTDGLSKVRFGTFGTGASARGRGEALQARGVIADFFIVRPASQTVRLRPSERLGRLQSDIVKTAERFLGTKYRWGGESAATGFDCSGLTMTVYRLNGLQLPRNSRSQFRTGTAVKRRALARGDLVFFATGKGPRVSHVGIYAGGDRFLHAPGTGKRIRFAALSNPYFKARYKGARRYF